jgi:hypothetical protein
LPPRGRGSADEPHPVPLSARRCRRRRVASCRRLHGPSGRQPSRGRLQVAGEARPRARRGRRDRGCADRAGATVQAPGTAQHQDREYRLRPVGHGGERVAGEHKLGDGRVTAQAGGARPVAVPADGYRRTPADRHPQRVLVVTTAGRRSAILGACSGRGPAPAREWAALIAVSGPKAHNPRRRTVRSPGGIVRLRCARAAPTGA